MTSFSFESVGHFFAAAFSDLHKALQFVEKVGATVETPAVEGTAEAISALVPGYGLQLVTVERAGFGVLGLALAAVHGVDDALVAKGVSVTLDANMVAALKALVADSKDELAKLGYRL